MTNLTEQLATESLPEYTEFYVRKKDGSTDTQTWLNRRHSSAVEWWNTFNITEVLAPVPSYEEYQKLLSDQLAKNEGAEINAELEERLKKTQKLELDLRRENRKLKETISNDIFLIKSRDSEIVKLKELLKECCYRIDWTAKTGHKPTDDGRQKLFNDIDQVLGEE